MHHINFKNSLRKIAMKCQMSQRVMFILLHVLLRRNYSRHKRNKLCKELTLKEGLDVIAKRNHNIYVSTELFGVRVPNVDVQVLSDKLQPWESVAIVVYCFRRFYD
mmetsp:Transcript_29446/g.33834  ORF Transcript_29446/g.33834 Transcript_29446/m.33834 type:complete len:106 (-) Transcript_29446:222-539(-)